MVSYVIPEEYTVVSFSVYHLMPGEVITLPASSGILSNSGNIYAPDLPKDSTIEYFSLLFSQDKNDASWNKNGLPYSEGNFSLGRLGEFTYSAHVNPPYYPPLNYDFFMYGINSAHYEHADTKYIGIVEFFVMDYYNIRQSDHTIHTALHKVDFTTHATVVGDAKVDTLILSDLPSAAQEQIVWSRDNDVVLLNLNDVVVTTDGIERFQFSQGTLAFDTDGHAGQAYRLYQAAFDREPDAEGLTYWIGRLDFGKATLNAIADSFLDSPEFVSTYGTAESVNNADFVELLYLHTLGREYDQSGFDYWVSHLDAEQTNRGDLLAFFSESDENVARVAPDIQDGIWLV